MFKPYDFSWISRTHRDRYSEYSLLGCCEFLMNSTASLKAGVLTPLDRKEVERYLKELEKLLGTSLVISEMKEKNADFVYSSDIEYDESEYCEGLESAFNQAKTRLWVKIPDVEGKFRLIAHSGIRYLWNCPDRVQKFLELRKTYLRYPAMILAHCMVPISAGAFGELLFATAYPISAKEFKARLQAFHQGNSRVEVQRFSCKKCWERTSLIGRRTHCYCGLKIVYSENDVMTMDTEDLFGDYNYNNVPLSLHKKSPEAILDYLRYTGPRLIKGK